MKASLLLPLAFLLPWQGAARADPSAPDESLAEALFREGREAMKTGDHQRACPKLAESHRLDPSPGALVNLALCEARIGKTASAWTKLRGFVEASAKDDPRLPLVQRELRELKPRLSHLKVTVADGARDVVVRLDGTELRSPSLGAHFPIDPGEHVLVLTTPEGASTEQVVPVREGERVEIALRLPEAAGTAGGVNAPEPSPAPPRPPARVVRDSTAGQVSALQTAGYATAAVGAAGLVASGVFLGLALHEKAIVDAECRGHVCQPEGLRAAKDGEQFLLWADVGAVVGVVGLVVGGGLVWYGSTHPVRVQASARGASAVYEVSFR